MKRKRQRQRYAIRYGNFYGYYMEIMEPKCTILTVLFISAPNDPRWARYLRGDEALENLGDSYDQVSAEADVWRKP